jgi:hypothetical protein
LKIQVKVKPNSKVGEVSREGDSFVVKVKEPPREGRANRAVIKLLAEHFGVPQSQVRIIGGFTTKNKVIEIAKSWLME